MNFGLRWEPTFSDPDKYGRGDFLQSGSVSRGSAQHRASDRACRAVLPWRSRGFPPRTGTDRRLISRRASAWCGIRSGDGRDTLRIGGALLYDSTETWFNERETTNPPYGNDIDVGSAGALQSVGWLSRAEIRFRRSPGSLFFPQSGTYINMPLNPKSTYVDRLECHLSAAVRQAIGWLRYPTWATRPLTSGSRSKEIPRFISRGTATRVNTV